MQVDQTGTNANGKLEVPAEAGLQSGKHLSSPLKKNSKRSSGGFSSSQNTNTSSMSLNVYEPVEKLDWNVKYLSDKHVRLYETCNKYNQIQAKDHFDHVAGNYEGMYLRMGYPDPEYVAKFVSKITQKDNMMPDNVKIIDFACGSGLVGKNLRQKGFKNIVGLDISPNMLEEASNKCVYSELHEHTLGNPEELPDQFKNHFDFVTCAGLINNNHMDYLLFEEMLLSVKKGGYAVFAARFSYMGLYWYDQILKEMEESGRWKLISSDTFFKYDKLDEVSIGRFSKTPSKVFIFQKLQDELTTYYNKDDEVLQSMFIKQKTFFQNNMAE